MIKRKRKLNKQKLVAVRRYTITGNQSEEVGHFYQVGTRVKRIFRDGTHVHKYVDKYGTTQWVDSCDLI